MLILIIVGVFITLAVGIFLLCAFVFPYKLARDMYDLGFNTYAVKLYDRAYEKDKSNIDALYMALNISIKLEDNLKIEEYYEEFSSNENYYTFIEAIDKSNYKKDTGVLIKSTLLSEDNYLKNRYINALINLGKIEEAVHNTTNSLINDPTVTNIGNYYYANFMKDTLKKENLQFFIDDAILDLMEEYLLKLNTDFKDTFALDKLPERVCAGNRIITVGYNILYLNARFDNLLLGEDKVNEITSIIDNTKSAINTLLME